MEFFIIKDDETGRRIAELLKAAARRGVHVRFLFDAVGSWALSHSFVESLRDAGVMCHIFMPVSLPALRYGMNFRNHRKIAVIDGNVAFTGGLNIAEEYEGKGYLGFWRDTFIRVEGEAVGALHKIFLADWQDWSGEREAAIASDLNLDKNGLIVGCDSSNLPELPMQVVASGLDSRSHPISRGYCSLIARARWRVFITTPYLVPGPEIINALISSSLAGVDVRIIMPSTQDHFLVYWASRGNIDQLLHAGVRVFLYKKGFVHSKTVTCDGVISSVGTCNFDVRSLEINFENQLFIYDDKIAAEFERQFEKDMLDCVEMTVENWTARPFWHKILESFGRLYSAQI